MPAPARPTGPISPADMLWRHELRDQNATLLRRMNALESRVKDQERRLQTSDEAVTTCTGLAEDFEVVKNGVDQLETKQRDFMNDVGRRLVDMDKIVDDSRKIQDRAQELMSSFQEINRCVEDLSSLSPRVQDVERELQGLKNSISRKYAQEIENLDARLEDLETQRSREGARIRTMQDEFTKRHKGELQALRTEMKKLTESGTKKTVPVQQPYTQVARSPEISPRSVSLVCTYSITAESQSSPSNGITSRQNGTDSSTAKRPGPSGQEISAVRHDAETQGTTQTSMQGDEIEDLDLGVAVDPSISPRNHYKVPQTGMSPRKRQKLTPPTPCLKPAPQPQQRPPRRSVQKPQQQRQMGKPCVISDAVPTLPPSRAVRHPINSNTSRKRPGSPISAPVAVDQRPKISAPPQPVDRNLANRTSVQEQKLQPSQPTRRSRRRSAQATVYELGWEGTQQPQKKAGPVYGSTHRPLKTKPRRLPPVPDE